MSAFIDNERKQKLCKILSSNLPTLRTKTGMSQKELADRLGFSRQTISAIEGKKRDMQWSTFSAIVLLLSNDSEVCLMMAVIGILGDDVRKTLKI